MSRAFVKDDDDRPERPLARPIDAERPNYVTERGLQLLHEALEKAQAAGDDRNAAYCESRIAGAVVRRATPGGTVAFGSTVVVREQNGRELRLQIVGEDEADPARGTIAWTSPYANALLGHRAGERVIVHRPVGAITVIVEAVE